VINETLIAITEYQNYACISLEVCLAITLRCI